MPNLSHDSPLRCPPLEKAPPSIGKALTEGMIADLKAKLPEYQATLVNRILNAFKDIDSCPMTDTERISLLRQLYKDANNIHHAELVLANEAAAAALKHDEQQA